MEIDAAQKRSFATAQAHGWWDTADDVNVPTKLALAAGELVGEALECYRDGKMELYFLAQNPETGRFGGKRLTPAEAVESGADCKPMGFGTELADAMIRIMDLAEFLEIDLDHLIQVKQNFNDTRPMRHGGKKV